MSWNFDTNPSGGSGNTLDFTKFSPGVTKIRVVGQAPYIRWVHWMNQHKRSVNCAGKSCPICQIRKQQKANKESYTYNMTRRFAIQIINRETGKLEIMEQGVNFFEDIRDIMEDLKEEGLGLQDADLRVKRRGTGKDDTSYRVDVDDTYPLSEADQKLKEDMVDLEEYLAPHDPQQILDLVNGKSWDEVFTGNEEEKEQNDGNENDEEIEIK